MHSFEFVQKSVTFNISNLIVEASWHMLYREDNNWVVNNRHRPQLLDRIGIETLSVSCQLCVAQKKRFDNVYLRVTIRLNKSVYLALALIKVRVLP